MDNFLVYFMFFVGLFLIIKGGDYFVDAASWIAEATNIPKIIIGATIISVATTLPELIVSVIASLKGNVNMAIGNAIGSVTANSGLVMGISIFCMPFCIDAKKYLTKSLLLLLSVTALLIFSLGGKLSPYASFVLIIIFIIFIYENIKTTSSEISCDKIKIDSRKDIFFNLLKFVIGFCLIIIGAKLLLNNAEKIAIIFRVPNSIIAVTIVAIGNALPELVTTITAILKKQHSLSIGNIIGSNIIGSTLILPLCSIISKTALPMSLQTSIIDLPISLLILSITLIPTLITSKFSRWQGILTILIYISYLFILVRFFAI